MDRIEERTQHMNNQAVTAEVARRRREEMTVSLRKKRQQVDLAQRRRRFVEEEDEADMRALVMATDAEGGAAGPDSSMRRYNSAEELAADVMRVGHHVAGADLTREKAEWLHSLRTLRLLLATVSTGVPISLVLDTDGGRLFNKLMDLVAGRTLLPEQLFCEPPLHHDPLIAHRIQATRCLTNMAYHGTRAQMVCMAKRGAGYALVASLAAPQPLLHNLATAMPGANARPDAEGVQMAAELMRCTLWALTNLAMPDGPKEGDTEEVRNCDLANHVVLECRALDVLAHGVPHLIPWCLTSWQTTQFHGGSDLLLEVATALRTFVHCTPVQPPPVPPLQPQRATEGDSAMVEEDGQGGTTTTDVVVGHEHTHRVEHGLPLCVDLLQAVAQAWSTAWVSNTLGRDIDKSPLNGMVYMLCRGLADLVRGSPVGLQAFVTIATQQQQSSPNSVLHTLVWTLLNSACSHPDRQPYGPSLLMQFSTEMPHPLELLITACLETLGCLAASTNDHTQVLLAFSNHSPMLDVPGHTLLPVLMKTLEPSQHRRPVRLLACSIFSNLARGTPDQKQLLWSFGELLPRLVLILENAEPGLRAEALFTLTGMLNTATISRLCIKQLLNLHCVEAVSNLLMYRSLEVLMEAIRCIHTILTLAASMGEDENLAAVQLQKCGALDRLEELQYHQQRPVYELARVCLETFFETDEVMQHAAADGIVSDFFEFKPPPPSPQTTFPTFKPALPW